ncbi:MAG TPA: hypothetical protein VFU43_02995 [Streptosporangiaceae bacterium]|nr:hypothetical protein [Streptosporangiaceae bacterium]
MIKVESPVRTALCPVGGKTIGFAGMATPARMKAETVCSCGGRHAVPSGGVAAIGLFAAPGRLGETWADPVAGTLGRGALAQTRLFYSITRGGGSADRVVRFSTDLDDLTGARPEVWPAVVAATLAGRPLPMPLTPYEGIFQLACGTTLSTSGVRERLSLHELELAELVDHASRLVGRPADPRELIRRALRHAVVDVLGTVGGEGRTGNRGGLVGDGGGLGAAALAAAGAGRLRRLHVHVDVPVLCRRRERLPADTVVLDGTAHWRRTCDGPQYGFLHDPDPWPPGPGLLAQSDLGSLPPLSAAGLVRLFGGTAGKTGWLRTGWLQLTTAAPFPGLFGERGWRAWHPPHARGDDEQGGAEGRDEHEAARPGAWISAAAERAGVAVASGRTTSHLVPIGNGPADAVPGAAAVRAVIEALERVPPPAPGDPRIAPVLICAHPVVLGAAVLLTQDGRLRVRCRDGYPRTAPLLRALLPSDWLPADVTPHERARLLAAAFVSRRLGTHAQRTRLLTQVEHSPWVDVDRLRAVLSDPVRVLSDAQALYRLYVTAAHHPEMLSAGVPG